MNYLIFFLGISVLSVSFGLSHFVFCISISVKQVFIFVSEEYGFIESKHGKRFVFCAFLRLDVSTSLISFLILFCKGVTFNNALLNVTPFQTMRLLTHNFLSSGFLKNAPTGYPLKLNATKIETKEADFDDKFIKNMIPKVG